MRAASCFRLLARAAALLCLLATAAPCAVHDGHLVRLIGPDGRPSGGREAPADGNLREVWTGSLYSSTFRAGVCTRPDGSMRGVLLLQLANGDVDVYHVHGKKHGDELQATHPSGHSFRGSLDSPTAVQGVISLKNGMNISLRGRRWQQAALPEEDACY
ncbi:MAG: hypothetical protein ACI33N_05695 [Desulfovibrionaceae bacterium]